MPAVAVTLHNSCKERAHLAPMQDYLAGGTKGGMWRPQRMPKDNIAFYQWGYNQACVFL